MKTTVTCARNINLSRLTSKSDSAVTLVESHPRLAPKMYSGPHTICTSLSDLAGVPAVVSIIRSSMPSVCNRSTCRECTTVTPSSWWWASCQRDLCQLIQLNGHWESTRKISTITQVTCMKRLGSSGNSRAWESRRLRGLQVSVRLAKLVKVKKKMLRGLTLP